MSLRGCGGGVEWNVEHLHDRTYEVSVRNTVTGAIEKERYTCQYPIVFGVDVLDLYEMDKIIKRLSDKVKSTKED